MRSLVNKVKRYFMCLIDLQHTETVQHKRSPRDLGRQNYHTHTEARAHTHTQKPCAGVVGRTLLLGQRKEIGLVNGGLIRRSFYSYHSLVFMCQGLLDMMIQEEESMRKRLISSIQGCRAEMETLYLELQLPIFEVRAMKIIQCSPWQHSHLSLTVAD